MIQPVLTAYALLSALLYLAASALPVAILLRRAPRLDRVTRRHWQVVALAFLALAGWRLGLGEMRLQDGLRAWSRAQGLYESRREAQVPLTLLLIAGALVGLWFATLRGLPGRSRLAMLVAIALVLFTVARLISLHALDSLLYRTGPFHLNYLFDIGPTLLCLLLAARELAHPTRRAEAMPPITKRRSEV